MQRRVALAGLLLAAPLALAFNVGGSRWNGGQATFHVNIPGVSPSGHTWNSAFESAMAEWSESTAFRFNIVDSYRNPCANYRQNPGNPYYPAGEGDGYNGVDFRADMCGNELGQSVAAVTLMSSFGGPGFASLRQTDIIFNSRWQWDVYDGPGPGIDFRRTALHELGHALGLDHESAIASIMAPRVSQSIYRLQPDDIAGANVLYGGPGQCDVRPLAIGASVQDQLASGDCAMFELLRGSLDTSYVDVYRLTLPRRMSLDLHMGSGEFDSVLVLTDNFLNPLDMSDDAGGSCDAQLEVTLEAGEYLLLANTYDRAFKCGGNQGSYRLSVNSTEQLIPGRSVSGLQSGALISGNVSADGGALPGDSFGPDDLVSVTASIQVDPAHVNQAGNLFMLAIFSDGRRYMKNAAGQWELLLTASGMPAWRSGKTLQAREHIPVELRFRPASIGFMQGEVEVYVGYSLGGSSDIIHNAEPIRFSVR